MIRFLLVCLGGAIGTGARYLVMVWSAAAFGPAFPVGTIIVNVTGSFLLGFLAHIGMSTDVFSLDMRLLLTTGIMGGFTTYSTFNYETTIYLRAGSWLYGSLNVIVTVLGCLAAGLLGLALARAVVGR